MTFGKKRLTAVLVGMLAIAAAAQAATEVYVFDKSHSKVGFQAAEAAVQQKS